MNNTMSKRMNGATCFFLYQITGNQGLKDMVEALKWVQRSIKSFGGDPDKVQS